MFKRINVQFFPRFYVFCKLVDFGKYLLRLFLKTISNCKFIIVLTTFMELYLCIYFLQTTRHSFIIILLYYQLLGNKLRQIKFNITRVVKYRSFETGKKSY